MQIDRQRAPTRTTYCSVLIRGSFLHSDRNFDVSAAKAKLLKAIKWRQDSNVDHILDEGNNPFLDKQMPYDLTLTDILGGPGKFFFKKTEVVQNAFNHNL